MYKRMNCNITLTSSATTGGKTPQGVQQSGDVRCVTGGVNKGSLSAEFLWDMLPGYGRHFVMEQGRVCILGGVGQC